MRYMHLICVIFGNREYKNSISHAHFSKANTILNTEAAKKIVCKDSSITTWKKSQKIKNKTEDSIIGWSIKTIGCLCHSQGKWMVAHAKGKSCRDRVLTSYV